MKKILLSFLLLALAQSLIAQSNINPILYRFNNKYFNLKTLQYKDVNGLLANGFKKANKYKGRFESLSMDKLGYGGALFQLKNNNALQWTDLESGTSNPLPNNEKDIANRGENYLLKSNTGIIQLKDLDKAYGFMVYKYNAKGEELFATKIEHSKYVENGNLKYHLPYLKYKLHTRSSIVFTSYVARVPKTILVSTTDGKQSSFDFTSIGVIRDEKIDMDIHGFISADNEAKSINISYISDNIKIQKDYFANTNAAETILLGDILVLATYNDSKQGINLLAVNLKTKEVLWEKAVPTINKKSAQYYFNHIWMSEYDGKIVLEGFESAGRHLQIYDTTTGDLTWKSF